MKNRLIGIFLMLFFTIGLSGCGNGSDDPTYLEEKYEGVSEQIEITDDEVIMTEEGIRNNLDWFLKSMKYADNTITMRVDSISNDKSHRKYICNVSFDSDKGNVDTLIMFDYQGALRNAEITESLTGELTQDHYDIFEIIVMSMMHHTDEYTENDAASIMRNPLNVGTLEGEYIYDSAENPYLSYDYMEMSYDLTDKKILYFTYTY